MIFYFWGKAEVAWSHVKCECRRISEQVVCMCSRSRSSRKRLKGIVSYQDQLDVVPKIDVRG